MSKHILYGEDARKKIKIGVDKLANAVIISLGPKGRNAILEEQYDSPTSSNDGVVIAKTIELKDKSENVSAQILKKIAEKMNFIVGDATTTVLLIVQSMIREGFKYIKAGADPLAINEGMRKACDLVIQELKENAKSISTEEEMAQVATISAKSKELGELVAKTISEIGKEGIITIEESKTIGIEREIVKGLQINEGLVSPYMITNIEKMEAILEEPYILITDKTITSGQEIIPILEKIINTGKKEILIIAEGIEGEALSTVIVNKLKGGLLAAVVKAPGYGSKKKEFLNDIAILTGGTVISEEIGTKLESVELSQLGLARRIISNKNTTTIIDGKGEKEKIDLRINQLKLQIEKEEVDYEKANLKERLAKMIGGIAVIKVGAASEVELKAKKHKIENALASTRAALEEGILPGGGVALLRCKLVLNRISSFSTFDKILSFFKLSKFIDGEKIGVEIIKKIIEDPIKQIAKNAGKNGSVIIEHIEKSGEYSLGYDASNDKYVDMIKSGIVDPTKAVRTCVEFALSSAVMLLTTECIVVNIPEDNKEQKTYDNREGNY